MPRNSNGVYSLTAGQPVTTGTVISSSTFNTLMNDVATALTQSLATTGVSTMSGQLKLTDGNVGAPGLTFGSDLDTGFYRIGANSFGMATNGTLRYSVNATGNHTFAAPDSGVALTVAGASGTYTAAFSGPNAASSYTRWQNSGTTLGDIGSAGAVISGGAPGDFAISSNTGQGFIIGTNGGAARISVSSGGNVTFLAPASGDTLTINSTAAGIPLTMTDGVVTSKFSFSGSTLQIGTTSAHETSFYTGNVTRLRISSSGNVSISAPNSGNALTITGVSGGSTLNLVNATGSVRSITYGNGTVDGYIAFTAGDAVQFGNSTAHELALMTNNTARVSIAAAGTVSISAPIGGPALVANGASGLITAAFLGATADSVRVELTMGGGTAGTDSFALIQDSGGVARLYNRANAAMDFSTNGAQRGVVTAGGNWTFNAPASGVGVTINAVSGQNGLVINGSGASINVTINGGSGNPAYLALVDGQTGNRPWRVGVGGSAVGSYDLYDETAAAFRFSINTSGDITARGVALVKFKSADTSRTSTITPTDDPDLVIAIPAAGTYAVEAFLPVINPLGSSGAQIRLAYSGTTTAAGNAAEGVINATAANALYGYSTTLGRIFQYATVSTADGDFVRITAYITVSTTGNLSIQWSQNSSTANALQLRRGAWLRATQVS